MSFNTTEQAFLKELDNRLWTANPLLNVNETYPGLEPGWWDARLEGDRSKVWACRRSKAAPSGFPLQVLAPMTALRSFRSNPSREMLDHLFNFDPVCP